MRPLNELVNETDSALPTLHEWVAEADLACEILPPSEESGRVLLDLQVTTRSPMGAIAHGTGGLLVDGGWLRILGSGHPRLPRNIVDWNKGRGAGFLLVADDVAGGFFAINGGALGADPGSMYYLAPDRLEWQALGVSYSAFVHWSLSSKLHEFYAPLRWDGWQADVGGLAPDRCFSFYPFLWTREGSPRSSARGAVDVAEQYALHTANQQGPEGAAAAP